MLRTTKFGIMFGIMALLANTAEAASIFLTPGTGEFGLNKEIAVDIKIDTEGVGINASQATIRFPKDILEVKSISKTDSVFSFWLEEPSFSNTDGAITFIGGTPYGISESSVQVLRVTFITKSSGTGSVVFSDAAVTASDGSGTNVLSKTTDAAFKVSPTAVIARITPPTQIVREPVPASGLPAKPNLTVSLYPSTTEWSNRSNVFTAVWDLPLDTSDIATAINKQPNYIPATSEGLFDNKMFEALPDGIWYLHVRFKNDIGWGVTAHYRIAVDTKAPLQFEITAKEGSATDNPTPSFNFKSSDALSGLREYRVKIDAKNWETISLKDFRGSYRLTNQKPGLHRLLAQAVDNAGNSIENGIDYEIIPLALPTFTFATDTHYSDESKGLSFKGTALPSTEIILSIKQGITLISSNTVPVDKDGNWEFTYSEPLRNGRYTAEIQNVDARGALSLVVTAPEIRVTGRYTSTVIVLLVVLFATIIGGYLFYKSRRARTALRIQVAERDAATVFKIIEDDVAKLQDAQRTSTSADEEFIAEKLKKNVGKMGSYIKEEIDRAKE